MASQILPLAIYAAPDQARADPIIQGWGNIPTFAVPVASLNQIVQAVNGLQSQIELSDPIVLLVSASSAASPLFQSVALYCQSQSKRLIVIDLDDVGAAIVTGNLKYFSDSVVSASDPELVEILNSPDRWTLPTGDPYPETGIKHQPKC